MSLLLSTEERHRFASWLEREVQTSRGLLTQLEKLGPAGAMIAAKEKQEMAAALIIINKLRSIEEQSIRG